MGMGPGQARPSPFSVSNFQARPGLWAAQPVQGLMATIILLLAQRWKNLTNYVENDEKTTHNEVGERKHNAIVESAKLARQWHGEYLIISARHQTTMSPHVQLSTYLYKSIWRLIQRLLAALSCIIFSITLVAKLLYNNTLKFVQKTNTKATGPQC